MARTRNLKEEEKEKIKYEIIKYYPELSVDSEAFQIKYIFFKEYLKNRRDSISSFEVNVDTTYSFFSCLGFNNDEIFNILSRNNRLIHMNNTNLLHRLLIVNRLNYPGQNNILKYALIEKSRDLTTGPDTAYARIKHIENLQKNNELNFRGGNPYTISTVFKRSNSEFECSFGISIEELQMKYPFYHYEEDGTRHILPSVLKELITWPGNQELLDNFFGKEKIV